MTSGPMAATSRAASWLVLGLLAGLYAAQSVTGSMVQTALPAVFRDAGMDLQSIGYLALLFLPWALKFLWAPLVDRFLRERLWILLCQGCIVLCFIAASFLDPRDNLPALAVVLFLMAVFAATQDIATDALAVKATTPATRGSASGASTAGAYLGFLVGGGLWLIVYSHVGWGYSMLVMAATVAMLSIPVISAKSLETQERSERISHRPNLKAIIANRTLVRGLAFILIYQTGIRLGSAMLGPFLVDLGLSLDAIGSVKGVGATIAGLVAASLGALLVRRFGAVRGLVATAWLNAAVMLSLLALALMGMRDPLPIIVLVTLQTAAVALSFVVLYAAMMDWCAPEQVATDYAALQSVDAIIAIAGSALAGLLGQSFGYGAIFGLSAAAILAAISLIGRLVGRNVYSHSFDHTQKEATP